MIRPKKSLGQHFLTDQNIIDKIADAVEAKPGDRVIEIGPGTGALTEALVDRFDELHAVELDDRAIALLREKFPSLQIHHQDVLKVDWQSLSAGKAQTHVVGNLPYYMVSQILFELLAYRAYISDALLMMQKEVAERLVANIGTKAYGILSVQTQLMSSPTLLFPVSRHCFNPKPRVESMMVRLKFDKGNMRCTDAQLKKVVRTAFNQRRKKLSNSLKPLVDKTHQPQGFDYDKRPEAWLPASYEKLTAQLVKNGILT